MTTKLQPIMAEIFYVGPAGGAGFRLGNRLFNYAATFGIE